MEFTEKAVGKWLAWMDVKTLCMGPGGLRENEYRESSDGELRDELFNREIFSSSRELKTI